MSNLLIAYNDIGQKAKTITSNRTFSKLHPLVALDSNNKSSYARYPDSTFYSSCNIDYDLGELNATDITATCSFICFPSWFLVLQDVVLKGDNLSDFSTATTLATISEATHQANQRGFYRADYLTTFSVSSAYRYYRLELGNGVNNTSGQYSKFFFGNMLDLGVNPNNVRLSSNIKESKLLTDAGYSYHVQIRPQKRSITIEWVGVTNAKIEEFKILFQVHNQPLIYLYSTNAEYLSGVDLVSANIMNYQVNYNDDYNTLTVELEEAI